MRTSRTRGSVCGLLLVLLGAWGGIAPFAGPVLKFGYTPDQAWASTQGRIYLSAVPAAVTVLAGLILMVTRSRGFGGFCAVVAALAGGWLIAGAALVRLLPASVATSVSTGTVLGTGVHRAILTSLAFFAGPGALIVFVAAVALGRLSLTAYKDYLRWPPPEDTGAGLSGIGLGGSAAGLRAGPPYGGYADPSAQTQDLYGAGAAPETYQAPAEQQYPVHDPFGLTQDYPSSQPGQGQYPRSQPPFPPAENPFAPTYQPGYSGQTLPEGQPGQDAPGPIGPGNRLERTYPPSDQPGQG
ncbi:MAG TPA: hypothetical protein VF843_12670 [Streptosporangiaceae bacterium]